MFTSVFLKAMIFWIVDVHNSCSGAMLTRAASLLSAILHFVLTSIWLGAEYCYDMGITWAGEFMDPNNSKAHEGLHYAGHEGG